MAHVRPRCKLIGRDGNVFAVIGAVQSALKKAGQADRATEFVHRAFAAGSYGAVLAMLDEYVEVRSGGVVGRGTVLGPSDGVAAGEDQ